MTRNHCAAKNACSLDIPGNEALGNHAMMRNTRATMAKRMVEASRMFHES